MRKMLLVALCLGLLLPALNCATILDGTKAPHERGKIMVGYVILDILFTGGLGLIIDFIDGAIYEKIGSRSEIEQNLQKYASQGKPCYRFSDDGVYKIESIDGSLKESKIEQSAIPPVVWQAIENQKVALQPTK